MKPKTKLKPVKTKEIKMNKELKDWEKEIHQVVVSAEYGAELVRMVKYLLKAQKAEILEKVNEIKKRFRCAACEGSKCQHTLGCQALEDIKTELKVDLNNK